MTIFLKNTTSYSLAGGTRIHARKDKLYLILAYPLKYVTLHHAWHRLFGALARNQTLTLDQAQTLLPEIPALNITSFLNQLVYRGFLTRRGNEGLERPPMVSVIIPVRNRPQEIRMCLEGIGGLEYPAGCIETIVVDDASTDTTAAEAAKFPVRLIRLKRHKQASFCRNVGARQARGDILAFIDSDCLAHPRWLLELVPAFHDPDLAAVGGRIDAYRSQNRLDLYEKAKSSLIMGTYAKQSQRGDPFFYVPACNFLIRRQVFHDLKGFNATLYVGEDVDLCWRLQDRQHRMAFWPTGVVFHRHRNRLPAFCRRRFQYGTSEPLLQKMHPKRAKHFLVPPAALVAWSFLAFWVTSGHALGLAMVCLTVLGDSLRKKRRLNKIPIGPGRVITAVVRSYGAFAYHLCAFVSRYYLFLAIICLPVLPAVSLIIAAMHLVNAMGEFRLKKPGLNFAAFSGFFTLEQLAYQAGVWWACLRHGVLRPVLPKIITRSSYQ